MFRNDDGNLRYDLVEEVWGQIDAVPYLGVMRIDGDLCFLNSYEEAADGSPLYLFSFVDKDVIRDVSNNRVDVRTAFSHYSAVIFKEIKQNDGTIKAVEVSYHDLDDSELPEHDAFL